MVTYPINGSGVVIRDKNATVYPLLDVYRATDDLIVGAQEAAGEILAGDFPLPIPVQGNDFVTIRFGTVPGAVQCHQSGAPVPFRTVGML